jgi:hypothetical protein
MRQREHPREATSGGPGAFSGAAIRVLIQIVAPYKPLRQGPIHMELRPPAAVPFPPFPFHVPFACIPIEPAAKQWRGAGATRRILGGSGSPRYNCRSTTLGIMQQNLSHCRLWQAVRRNRRLPREATVPPKAAALPLCQ